MDALVQKDLKKNHTCMNFCTPHVHSNVTRMLDSAVHTLSPEN